LAVPWSELPLTDLLEMASVERIREAILAGGAAAPLASMALMVIHSFVPFPAEMLAIANGMVFGLVLGTAVTWAGAMLGAIAAFGLARWVGQAFVYRLIGEHRRAALERWTEAGGVRALLVARLIPVISFNLINYAAGLAGVGWWPFLWTTAVGILPVTVVSVLVGSHMVDASWQLWLLLAAALVLLGALHRRKRLRDA
jgi:uncharacterized membrane protein YdjX (TVP38/TMEM64 family)